MRSIFVLRHAKAATATDAVADFERPLRRRGRAAAKAAAEHLRSNGWQPDLVLCSTARRTRETAEPILELFANGADAVFERGLYLAEAPALLARLQKVPDAKSAVLVIGHNPGLQELVLLLASKGQVALRTKVAEKFPTAALAHLRFSGRGWRELAPSSAQLVAFVTPGGRDD